MKLKGMLVVATIVALTGCASGPSDYALYSQTQQLIAQERAKAEVARSNALKEIAQSGDASAKVAAVMSLQFGNPQAATQVAAPSSPGDTALKWASVLFPSLTQIYGISKNAEVAIINSNNSLEGKRADNGMIVDLVKGREPIIGTEGDVLLYPVAP